MIIWIDADAAPRDVKEIVFRAALRLELETVLVANARITLHVTNLGGDNTHHVYESVFKAVAVALRRAVRVTTNASVGAEACGVSNACVDRAGVQVETNASRRSIDSAQWSCASPELASGVP